MSTLEETIRDYHQAVDEIFRVHMTHSISLEAFDAKVDALSDKYEQIVKKRNEARHLTWFGVKLP